MIIFYLPVLWDVVKRVLEWCNMIYGLMEKYTTFSPFLSFEIKGYWAQAVETINFTL